MSVAHPYIEALPDAPAGASGVEAILAAVVFGAREFLNRSDWSGVLDALLERLGTATGSDQVRVFMNDRPVPGEPVRASLLAQWLSPRATAGSPVAALQGLAYGGIGCARWETLLAAGEPVVGPAVELPASEQAILLREGVVSVAMVPIFTGSRWWGFIGFADCTRPRRWMDAELNALFAAASILGAAHARRRMEQRVARVRTQERLAAQIGEAVMSPGRDVDAIVAHCAAAVVQHVDADAVRIWVLDATGDALVAAPAVGREPIELPASETRMGLGSVGAIAQQRAAQVWPDALPEFWPGSGALLEAAGLRAGAGLPLIAGDRLLGVVVLLLRQAPTAAQLETLGTVTDDIAVAIEHGRAQAAMRRSEERYRRLVDATLEGIAIHDGRRIFDANPSVAAMTGFALDDIIGGDPFDFLDPSCHADVRARIAARYAEPYEAAMKRADGTVFPVEIRGRDFIIDGAPLRIAAIRDITLRKAAEESARRLLEAQAAREAAEQTRRQAEFLGEASRILASSFDTSTTLNQLAQLSVPELGDACIVSLLEHGQLTAVAEVCAQRDRGGAGSGAALPAPEPLCVGPRLAAAQSLGLEFIVPSDRGEGLFGAAEERALLHELGATALLCAPIRTGGELIGSLLLVSGAGGRSYDDADLALAQELGRRAAVAVQSARSYHDAQAATRARDDMLAVVAHDLRNPLSTIDMGSALALEMLDADPPVPPRRQLEIIGRTAQKMNRLIQDLLDTTRLQSGQLALELAAVRPESIVTDAVELLQPLAAHAGIAFHVHVADALPAVRADSARVLQALSNLVGNAVKFTPRGGSITLAVDGDDAGARFRVIDTGPGISAEQLPRIFSRGWQGRSTDRRGLGLGLAIAKGIIEAHGGSIRVESRVGTGSTFTFTIPAAHAAAAREPERRAPAVLA